MHLIQGKAKSRIKNPRRVCIGAISKNTLHKKIGKLNENEKDQFCHLRDQIIWAGKNGYYIVMTTDDRIPYKVECWMIKKTSMPFLPAKFRKKIYQVF